MMTPEALSDGLTAHLAASLGIDSASADEMAGARQMAEAALDYFRSNVRGGPATGPASAALLWAIYSGLLADSVPQERIDKFFSNFQFNVPELIAALPPGQPFQLAALPPEVNVRNVGAALERLSPEDRASGVTVALIPGSLSEADIADVVRALYQQRAGN
mgnify:CR=1 FL=1